MWSDYILSLKVKRDPLDHTKGQTLSAPSGLSGDAVMLPYALQPELGIRSHWGRTRAERQGHLASSNRHVFPGKANGKWVGWGRPGTKWSSNNTDRGSHRHSHRNGSEESRQKGKTQALALKNEGESQRQLKRGKCILSPEQTSPKQGDNTESSACPVRVWDTEIAMM